MMIRIIIAALCAGFMGSAMAVDEGGRSATANEPIIAITPTASAVPAAPIAPASSVPETRTPETRPAETGTPETSTPQANPPISKSSIPLDKRQGGDVTHCLELKSNQEIAACAAKIK